MVTAGGGSSAFSKVSAAKGKAAPVKATVSATRPVASKAGAPRRPSSGSGGSTGQTQQKASSAATPSNASSGEGKDKVNVNRKLLQNLFAGLGAGGSDDDDDDDDEDVPQAEFDDREDEMMMSFRQIPGTPKSGQRRGNVPTISSPAASKKPATGMMQPRTGPPTISATANGPPKQSLQNPPTISVVSSSSAKGSSITTAYTKGYSAQNNPSTSVPNKSTPQGTYASQNASKREPSPGGKITAGPAKSKAPGTLNTSVSRVPPPALNSPSAASVSDGYYEAPPARLPSPKVVSGAYPRPALAQPSSSNSGAPVTGPIHVRSTNVVTTGAPIGRTAPPVGARGGVGYANRHTPSKQSAANSIAQKPAAAPRCGPKAFDLLRKLDAEKTNDDEESEFFQDGNVDFDHQDVGDDFSDEDGQALLQAGADLVDRFPGAAKHASTPSSGPPPKAIESPATGAAPTRESASEYVERLKRGLQMGDRGGGDGNSPSMEEDGEDESEELAAYRRDIEMNQYKRDIQIREAGLAAQNTAKAAAAKAPPCPPAPQIQFNKHSVADDNESDSDDGSAPVIQFEGHGGADGYPGKGDVKSMVQKFAQEERARNAAGGRPTGKPPAVPNRQNQDSTPKAAADPNAKRAEANPEERLFFSRKARAVDYQPASVADYKDKYGVQEKEKDGFTKVGSLGADLEDENLLMKHAVQEKVKQFSKELHRINRERQHQQVQQEKPKPAPKKEPTARDKALEFAKKLPKPEPKPTPPKAPKMPKKEPEKDAQQLEHEADLADWAEITRREAQHFLDKEKVQEIKAFLSQIVVKD